MKIKEEILKANKCPFCNKDDSFAIVTMEDKKTPAVGYIEVKPISNGYDGGLSIGGPSIFMVFKTCLSCGFTAGFNLQIVEKTL
jgi:hypothetical protein